MYSVKCAFFCRNAYDLNASESFFVDTSQYVPTQCIYIYIYNKNTINTYTFVCTMFYSEIIIRCFK